MADHEETISQQYFLLPDEFKNLEGIIETSSDGKRGRLNLTTEKFTDFTFLLHKIGTENYFMVTTNSVQLDKIWEGAEKQFQLVFLSPPIKVYDHWFSADLLEERTKNLYTAWYVSRFQIFGPLRGEFPNICPKGTLEKAATEYYGVPLFSGDKIH